ncbi:UDP-glucose dehydrogenase family protein [Parapusillimonas granuli]|uniref:UDP-glucose 6-dehydrogenase n=1 Tax=Parapusillimonas granuli TaxID=380911 RepID=A0A853FXT7_9BURK|nr:UDP-glucose/GDP-mannose dehydrogenase family protein [Parapusillimonas granuli]MBB5213655.1 UDPglucose 6-dehydrogenase [Parapusillimonas granuli]MEB2398747.1 UDP-glucose/GDP-mannose dehydrogenase family protein [Alcaligenaceae bacterium]NYT48492.1 UDP-glucose/GDP-mannose dehydrogenase family protein [Parapusillimonas granuli]
MKVVVIGSGYVGLVTGCCLAEAGNQVVCVDHDAGKVAALRAGRLPFHEPGLDELLAAQLQAGRLSFETSIARAMRHAAVAFLAVGTPSQTNGSANLENLLHCVHELADTAFEDCVIVVKSTVPIGTGDHIEKLLNAKHGAAAGQPRVRVASNPEFLAEGRAIRDFRHPSRIVVGANDEGSAQALAELYAPFVERGASLMFMDRRSAEFAKYACNAMLAARISMVNELAGLAGSLGAGMEAVCRVLKSDPRIGAGYLQPGAGYGGSCLPKDLRALIRSAQEAGEPAYMLRSVQRVNRLQGRKLFDAIRDHFGGGLRQRRIAIWGLSFKPGTDDVRSAPSLALIHALLGAGATVSAYDPVAMNAARAALGDTATVFGESALNVCEEADALVLMTEWEEFKAPDFEAVAARLRGGVVFDARGIYRPGLLRRHGLQCHRLGERPAGLQAGKAVRAPLAPNPQAEPRTPG